MNILFTCAGRRNYLINYFKEALSGEGKVFATDMQLTAPALVDADIAIQVPSIYSDDYISTLWNIIKENKISAVISLNDLELPILSKHRAFLENSGAKIIISDMEVIDISFDKWKTVKFLENLGLGTPKTYIDIGKAKEALERGELRFPLVVKPRWGSASIGVDFVESLNELELSYQLQKIRLARTILAEASKDDFEHAILIQEKIQGPEYGMDVLNDFNGNYFGTFVRQKLAMRSGETDKAISIEDERFEEIGRKIGRELKHMGNLDCDVFEYDSKLYVLELNPRFGGGYPFSHEAGNNAARIYVEWLRDNTDVERFSDYTAGLMFAKCDRLLKVN